MGNSSSTSRASLSAEDTVIIEQGQLQLNQSLDGFMRVKKEEIATALSPVDATTKARLHSQCRSVLKEAGVKLVVMEQDALKKLESILEAGALGDTSVHTLPIKVVDADDVNAQSKSKEKPIALSYRHGGANIRVIFPSNVGQVGHPEPFSVNANALKALMQCSHLNKPVWVDELCIRASGHTLQEAFAYMGPLYAFYPVYSQVNWNSDVDTYLTRGWVLQEFLLAEQLIDPALESSLKAGVARMHRHGVTIAKALRNISLLRASELVNILSPTIVELAQEFSKTENKIFKFLTNDANFFWMDALKELEAEAIKQVELLTLTHDGTRAKDIIRRIDLAKRCTDFPKAIACSPQVIDDSMRMQKPTTEMLGRLEINYMTAALYDENDRPSATFGVFNFLSGREITFPAFAGAWPSIRGSTITAMRFGSGFGPNAAIRAIPLIENVRICPIILERLQTSEVEKEFRLVVLAISEANTPYAFWTFSNSKDIQSAHPGRIFQVCTTYAEEIDQHFSVPQGSVRPIFVELTKSHHEEWQKSPALQECRYDFHYMFGYEEVVLP